MAISGYFSMEALTEYDKVLYNFGFPTNSAGRPSLRSDEKMNSGNTNKSLKKKHKNSGTIKSVLNRSQRSGHSRRTVKKGVLPLMIKIIHDLIKNKLSQKDLDLAKHFKKCQIEMNLSEIENMAIFNGTFLLLKSHCPSLCYDDSLNKKNDYYEKYFSLKDLYKTKYEHITLNEMNECIMRYFVKSNMNVFMIGEHVLSKQRLKSECEKEFFHRNKA
jgi:hypothetical protein